MVATGSMPSVSRAAWVLAVLGGVLWVVFGLVILILPGDPGNRIFFTGDPSTYPAQAVADLIYAAQVSAVALVIAGLMQVLIALTAFKRAERWAWYALATTLILVPFSGYVATIGRNSVAAILIQFLTFWIFQAIALLLSVRSVFPSKTGVSPS